MPDNDLLLTKHKILERLIRRLEAATKDKEVNTAVDIEMEYDNFIKRNIAEAEQTKLNEAEALALAQKEHTTKEDAFSQTEKK